MNNQEKGGAHTNSYLPKYSFLPPRCVCWGGGEIAWITTRQQITQIITNSNELRSIDWHYHSNEIINYGIIASTASPIVALLPFWEFLTHPNEKEITQRILKLCDKIESKDIKPIGK